MQPASASSSVVAKTAAEPARLDGVAAWEVMVSTIMDAKPALGAVLQHGMPMQVSRQRVVLSFPTGSFFGRQAEALDAKQAIVDVAERVMGARPAVEITYGDGTATGTMKPLVQVEKERRDARIEAAREKALSHPLVLEAAQVFALSRESMTVRVELE